MGEVFTFFGLINHSHGFIIVAHVLLTVVIVLAIAKAATSSMQIVPKGAQNVAEIYLNGVVDMGRDVIGEEKAKQYLP